MRTFVVSALLACSITLSGCNQLFPQHNDDEAEDQDDSDSGGIGFGGSNMENRQGGNQGGPVISKDNAQQGAGGNSSQQSPLYSWFLGSWTDDGNCGNVITMRPDGVFVNPDGSQGNWALNGDQLTMSGNQGSLTVTLRQVDQNRLQLVFPDGTSGYSTRC